jgi:GntR family transcriptional repressor for pyruvate dehydrogenase complex
MRAQAALVGEQSPMDVMVARRALDPLCARHAALHRRSHDLHVLRDRLERHAGLVDGSMEAVSEANLAFHLALTNATHNPVLVMLAERLTEVMQESVWHVMKLRPQEERTNVTAHFLEEHAAILEAVERQDDEAAFRAMHAHLDSVEATLFSTS